MPSLIQGYEYDIFISYRHKDNKGDHWVTEFVNALKTELEATFKEDISIYFDSNPHDGLLETHSVDKSLEGKLKCLIFLPIISQTYCDPKSFAWQHEFCAFNKFAQQDQFGRDIKLGNGNVASRILPICIHELDASDKQFIETELGNALRGIEFIYRNAGVVRPLKAIEEDAKANLNRTYYRDQINKVARAIKEITTGLQNPTASENKRVVSKKTEEVPAALRKKIALTASLIGLLGLLSFTYYYFGGFGSQLDTMADKSIAVLPFENMNHDPEQDYFSNGIAEDILNNLVKISDLKVKSRTSTLQYKGTQKSIIEIGEELNVGNIVEGSVRRVGDKVRIVVQLIDAKTDLHLWSETYDRDLKDVLTLQSEIAIEIAKKLEARLTSEEQKNINKEFITDVTSYDYFLKAREIMNGYGGNEKDLQQALSLVNEAIRLDTKFSKSYALKGEIWYQKASFGIHEKVWTDSSLHNASKAISLDPSSGGAYIVRARVLDFIGKLKERDEAILKAYQVDPTNPGVQNIYGRLLLVQRNEKGADIQLKAIENQYQVQDPRFYVEMSTPYYYAGDIESHLQLMKKGLSLNPNSTYIRFNLASTYYEIEKYGEALEILRGGDQDDPSIIDQTALVNYLNKNYEAAAKGYEKYTEIESQYEDSTQSIPFRHRLAMTYLKLGRKKEADQLILEHTKILNELITGKRGKGSWIGLGGIYYDYALCQAYQGEKNEAIMSLDSAFKYGWQVYWFYHNDPLLANLYGEKEFARVLKKVDDNHDFRRNAFINAINRAKANDELKKFLR